MNIKETRYFKFLLLCLLFVGTSVMLMPINQVPDEMNHARMAWEIIHQPTKNNFKWMDEVVTSPEKDKKQYEKEINKKIDLSNEKIDINVSIKSINHLPQLIGMMLMSIFTEKIFYIVMMGRIFNGLLYCIGCYYILKKLKFGQLAFMFISLLPIMVQQAGSLSYDVANYLAISYFFAVITEVITKKDVDKKIIVQLVLSALFLYITKTNNLLLLAVLPFIETRYSFLPVSVEKRILHVKEKIKKHRNIILPVFLILGICAATFIIGIKTSPLYYVKVMLNTLLNNNLNGYLNTILTVGMFGYVGNFILQFPLWFIYLDIIVLFIFMMHNPENYDVSKTFGYVSALVFPIQVLVIITGMYFMWTPIALGENANISVGAQGRYFTPFLIYFVPSFYSIKDKFRLSINGIWVEKVFTLSILFNYLMMLSMILTAYWINL